MYEDDSVLKGWVRVCATNFDKLDYSPINPKGRRDLDILWVDALLVLDKKLSTLTCYVDKSITESIGRFNRCLQKSENKQQAPEGSNFNKLSTTDLFNGKGLDFGKKEKKNTHLKIARASCSLNTSNLHSLPEDGILGIHNAGQLKSSPSFTHKLMPSKISNYNTIGYKFFSPTATHGSYYPNSMTSGGPMFSSQLALSRQESITNLDCSDTTSLPKANPPGLLKNSLYHQRRGSLPVVSVLDSRQAYLENGHLKTPPQLGPNTMASTHGVNNTQSRISDVFNGLFRVKSIKNNLKRTKSAIKLDNRKQRKPEEEEENSAKKGSLPTPLPSHSIRNCRSHESLACGSPAITGYDDPNGIADVENGGALTIRNRYDLNDLDNICPSHKTVLRQPFAFQLTTTPRDSPSRDPEEMSPQPPGPAPHPPVNHFDYYSCSSAVQRAKWVHSIRDTINQGCQHDRRRENCLQIWILEAKGVPGKKRYFCEVYLDRNLHARTASKIKGDLCFWGETFDFKGLPDLQTLSVHFYRDCNEKKKKREKPQFIGSVTIPIEVITGNQFYEKWYQVNAPTSAPLVAAKGGRQEKPAIRIKARYQTFNILPIHLYKDFLHILTEDYMSVCQYLESQVSVKTKEDVAGSLVYIFEHFGMAEEFLTSIVEMEVNKLENESLTFRGNSLATKSIEAYMKYIALPYLRKTLSDFITVILESNDDCEVDPTKVSGKSTLYRNQQNLTMYCEMAWSKIINSYSYFPLQLRKVFQSIRKRLESSCHKPEISDNVISASIFLRFLCPAILSPSLFGLVQEYPQERAARNLTLIAKTIQTLANSNKFGGKEGYMNFMNHFVEREWINMKCFLRKISSLDSNNTMSNSATPINFSRKDLNLNGSLPRKSLGNGHYNNCENGGFALSQHQHDGDQIEPGWGQSSIDLGKELSLAHSRLNETLDKVQPLPLPDDQFYVIHTKLKLVLDALEEALGNDKTGRDFTRFEQPAPQHNQDCSAPASPLCQTNAMRRSLRFQKSLDQQESIYVNTPLSRPDLLREACYGVNGYDDGLTTTSPDAIIKMAADERGSIYNHHPNQHHMNRRNTDLGGDFYRATRNKFYQPQPPTSATYAYQSCSAGGTPLFAPDFAADNTEPKNVAAPPGPTECDSNKVESSRSANHNGSQLSLGMASSGYHTLNTKHRQHHISSNPVPCPLQSFNPMTNKEDGNYDSSERGKSLGDATTPPIRPAGESGFSPYSSANEEENNSLNSSGTSSCYPETNGETQQRNGMGVAHTHPLLATTPHFDASKVQDSILANNSLGFSRSNKILHGDTEEKFGALSKGSMHGLGISSPWIPTVLQNGNFHAAHNQPSFSNEVSRGKFFKNPASLVIDPILPKYHQNGRGAHRKSNVKQQAQHRILASPFRTSDLTSTDKNDGNDDEFALAGLYHKKIASTFNGALPNGSYQTFGQSHDEEKQLRMTPQNLHQSPKTPLEYEIEIDCLRKKMRSLQIKLVETEERLTSTKVINASCVEEKEHVVPEITLEDYKKEKDQQMGLILNRLMVLERELRLEHEDINSTVKDKQMIIEAQERRIRELNQANEKLVKTLGRLNNGVCYSNPPTPQQVEDLDQEEAEEPLQQAQSTSNSMINFTQSPLKNNGTLSSHGPLRLSSNHHLTSVGPPNKTIMKLVNPLLGHNVSLNGSSNKRRDNGELLSSTALPLHKIFLGTPQKSSNC